MRKNVWTPLILLTLAASFLALGVPFTVARGVTTALWQLDTAEQLVLRAEVPGVAEEDLDVTIDQETLTLKGTRKIEIPEGYTVHRQERAETTFARSFSLPCKVDADKTQAVLKDGLLTVNLPKAPEVHARQIAVKSA